MRRRPDVVASIIQIGLVIGAGLLAAGRVAAQETGGAAMELANKALSSYVQNVLTEQNVSRFGFSSLKEARSARVGAPVRVMFIRLDHLKKYDTGTRPAAVLTDARKIWFPVMVGDETRAKLEMIEKDGTFVPGEFGGAVSSRRVTTAQRTLAGISQDKALGAPRSVALVRVPWLAAEFIYMESGDGSYFLPAMKNPERLSLKDGHLYRAEELLPLLHEFARDIDPNKVM